MNLRFPESELEQIAKRRVPSPLETGLINLKPDVQQRGYLDKKLLKRVAYGNRRGVPSSLIATTRNT